MIERIDVETEEFEQCTVRLQALRMVLSRMLREALVSLTSDHLREEVSLMQTHMQASLLKLGARKAFIALCGRLRAVLVDAQTRSNEIRDMLGASFGKLNSEFGFSLAMTKAPDLARFTNELAEVEASYTQYLGLSHALRLSQPKFMEQFRRMLMSKLRVVFENASAEIELWNKATSSQIDSQLRERRRNFRRRRESLERVQTAASDLELRIAELEAQDERLQGFLRRARELIETMRESARAGPVAGSELISLQLPPQPEPALQRAQA